MSDPEMSKMTVHEIELHDILQFYEDHKEHQILTVAMGMTEGPERRFIMYMAAFPEDREDEPYIQLMNEARQRCDQEFEGYQYGGQ